MRELRFLASYPALKASFRIESHALLQLGQSHYLKAPCLFKLRPTYDLVAKRTLRQIDRRSHLEKFGLVAGVYELTG